MSFDFPKTANITQPWHQPGIIKFLAICFSIFIFSSVSLIFTWESYVYSELDYAPMTAELYGCTIQTTQRTWTSFMLPEMPDISLIYTSIFPADILRILWSLIEYQKSSTRQWYMSSLKWSAKVYNNLPWRNLGQAAKMWDICSFIRSEFWQEEKLLHLLE